MLTPRQRILTLLKRRPGLSAYQIADRLDLDIASVSSDVKRLTDKGVLTRVAGAGPRGGFTYAHA